MGFGWVFQLIMAQTLAKKERFCNEEDDGALTKPARFSTMSHHQRGVGVVSGGDWS